MGLVIWIRELTEKSSKSTQNIGFHPVRLAKSPVSMVCLPVSGKNSLDPIVEI